MDDPSLDPREHRRALAGLDRVNRWTRSTALVWPCLLRAAKSVAPQPLSVLDVATGSGAALRELASLAKRHATPMTFAGCDISPTAVRIADSPAVFVHDVLKAPLPGRYDVVMTSLFLHHLSESDAVTVLQRLQAAARRTVLVTDLARGHLNRLLVSFACHTLSRSPIVHFDGPASVRSAFTVPEAVGLADAAGLHGAVVAPSFPCRWRMVWERP